MIERFVPVPAGGGSMETFVTHPSGRGPYPPVVVYMDVWGVREELLDIARRIATVGYYAMVPDLYWRQGRVRHEFRDANGRMISLEKLDDARRAQVREPMLATSDAMVMDDTAALLRFIDTGEPVRPGPVGSVGYCLGGRLVLRAAGTFPERFRAGASMHGTRLATDAPDSAHLVARKARGELYCGYAEHDPFAPPATIAAMAEAMRGVEVTYHHTVHAGAEHGYALPDRDIHDKQAANRDWEVIFSMFRRQLPPGD